MNALKCLVFITTLFLICGKMSAQNEQKKFKIAGVGFYNLENLFDTVNETLMDDEEFLPDGARTWTPER